MYEKTLAEIHDRWFDAIPRAAAVHLSEILGTSTRVRILDLGCGSGTLLSQLTDRADELIGVDVSEAMIEVCRQKIPDGTFLVGDILSAKLPEADVISMVGEILSYASSRPDFSDKDLYSFFANVYDALRVGGIFLFDVLGADYDYSGRFMHDQDEYTVFSQVTANGDLITRSITSFLKKEAGYAKSFEVHTLRAFKAEKIETALKNVGLVVKRLHKYGDKRFLPGRIGFECYKRV